MKVNVAVRLLESLVALQRVYETGVKMDLREVILRYVSSSRITTHRIIYQLIKRGYVNTVPPEIGVKIVDAVQRKLSELKWRKGPYVGFTIASAVESIANNYKHIDWVLTERGLRYLDKKLGELGLTSGDIKKSPLSAVLDVRRRIEMKFSGMVHRPLFVELVDDVEAAKAFVAKALHELYPRGVEPKAGFAISFARDEDAVADMLIMKNIGGKTLWKLLNTEYINPLVTNYRNYLIMYSISMLYPESYRGIESFIENATNWFRLAKEGRAEPFHKYLGACLRSGYVVDRGGVLEFVDPFILHGANPRSVIEYLNDIYFANTIVATGLLAFGRVGKEKRFKLNIRKAVSSIAATLIWQSAYSYPIPIVRKGEKGVDSNRWYEELVNLKPPVGTILAFPRVIEALDKSISIKVLDSYINDFVNILLMGNILHTVRDPKGDYEVLLPHGIAVKLFNMFREDKVKGTRVSELVYALKRLLSEKGIEEPLIRRDKVKKVLVEVFGSDEPILSKLVSESIIIPIGEHYVITPYDLPAVYLDLLKGPVSVVHAQLHTTNMLQIVSLIGKNMKEEFQVLLSELEKNKRISMADFKDVVLSFMDVIHNMKSWGVIKIDYTDRTKPILELSDDFKLDEKYDAGFVIRALREIIGWKVFIDTVSISINEAKGELKEHIEGKDAYEMFETINKFSKAGLVEPPYE